MHPLFVGLWIFFAALMLPANSLFLAIAAGMAAYIVFGAVWFIDFARREQGLGPLKAFGHRLLVRDSD